MIKSNKDINDDEIRIISSRIENDTPPRGPKFTWKQWLILVCVLVLIIAAVVVCAITMSRPVADKEPVIVETQNQNQQINKRPATDASSHGEVLITDTVVNGVSLTIFTPLNLTPTLHVGDDILETPSVKLVAPAADIREDDGGIVGAFVLSGELITKGRSKAGYCSIIDGNISVGVADATPLLEQAIESDGYFFRQYPLVVGGQIVENKPQGRSLRKALAELNGRHVVIVANDRQTFHDFSATLVDLGVTNAIYLVGSVRYGYAIDKDGTKVEFGKRADIPIKNQSYIVWQ